MSTRFISNVALAVAGAGVVVAVTGGLAIWSAVAPFAFSGMTLTWLSFAEGSASSASRCSG